MHKLQVIVKGKVKKELNDSGDHHLYIAIDIPFGPECYTISPGESLEIKCQEEDKSMNYMKQVAEMLGVEIGEKFKIIDEEGKQLEQVYYLTEHSLTIASGVGMPPTAFSVGITFMKLVNGTFTIKKLPWVPKEGDAVHYIDPTEDCGYGWWRNVGYSDIEMLTSRGLTLYRTEEEVKSVVKELGWEVE